MIIPTNLEEAIEHLTKSITPEEQIKIMGMTERDFTSGSHFGIGINIRNEWGLWKEETPLVKYFHSIGINHPDDMSDIILTSTCRTIMAQPVNLEGQLKKKKDYWDNFPKGPRKPVKYKNL